MVDRLSRQALVQRVQRDWRAWQGRTGGWPEEYLAELEKGVAESGLDSRYQDAQHYVAITIAFRMGRVRSIGGQAQLAGAYVHRAAPAVHREFWRAFAAHDLAVLTTNYDVLAERGLGLRPTRTGKRGFHYGTGPVQLKGRGYPSFAHLRPLIAQGPVPLLKLHGSVSWSKAGQSFAAFRDCRPAVRGDAAILAPTAAKRVPNYLAAVWAAARKALRAPIWVIVGHSVPQYDVALRDLLADGAHHAPTVHVLNPDPMAADEVVRLLPGARVMRHAGLPDGTATLRAALHG